MNLVKEIVVFIVVIFIVIFCQGNRFFEVNILVLKLESKGKLEIEKLAIVKVI